MLESGSTLLTDEAVGVRVIEELSAHDLPENVELLGPSSGELEP